jgi:hypothetical protein
LQAVIGDDPLDAPQANLKLGLAQLLGNDGRRGLGVQKAVAQDLPHDLVGPAVIGFGARLLRFQSAQACGSVVRQELVITLAAKTVLPRDVDDLSLQTFAFQEHEEAVSQPILGRHRELANGADELVSFRIELQGCIHGESVQERRAYV